MPTTQYDITGVSRVTFEHTAGAPTAKHIQTDFFLEVSNNLDTTQYLDEEQLPSKMGVKSLTVAFVQGLVGNIHHAHDKGYWDSAEHLRYIMDLLQKGFSTVAYTEKANF